MAAAASPQPLVVGEEVSYDKKIDTNEPKQQSYAELLQRRKAEADSTKLELIPVAIVHGDPTIEFTMDQVNEFAREEGLHQAVMVKFSYGKPELQDIRKNLPTQFDIQGRCNIGLLEYRHLLIRFDLYNDFVKFLSRTTGYMKSKGEKFFFRTFPWTINFNPKEETSMDVVWISFPGLTPNFFAKRSLLSISSAVGKALTVDKATQERTRPSEARVKVILDLMEKHPNKVKIVMTDRISGKSVVHEQSVVYDNLPRYCTYCKRQGHEERSCRFLNTQVEEDGKGYMAARDSSVIDTTRVTKLQGDVRDYLNRKIAGQQENIATTENLDQQAALIEEGKHNSTAHKDSMQNRVREIGNVGEAVRIDKGTPKPSRDVPARTAIARIASVVNPIVEAYDKLAIAAKIMSTGAVSQNADVCDEIGIQKEKAAAFSRLSVGQLNENNGLSKSGDPLSAKNDRFKADRGGDDAQLLFRTCADRGDMPKDGKTSQELTKEDIQNLGNNSYAQNAATGTCNLGDAQVFGAKATESKGDLGEDRTGNQKFVGRGSYQNKNEEEWNTASHRKSPTKKGASPKCQKPGVRLNDLNAGDRSNSFEVLGESGDPTNDVISLKDAGISKQLVQVHNNEQGSQRSRELVAKLDVRRNDSTNILRNQIIDVQEHSSNVPTLHFSNPHVEQIIKDAQHEMIKNTTLVTQPVVALNTSIFEVPTQSVESFGDYEGESGQLILSTGNNNAIMQSKVREMASNSKLWHQQREYDDEEDWGDGVDVFSFEDEQDTAREDIDAPVKHKLHGKATTSHTTILNHHALNFIPTKLTTAGQLSHNATTILGQKSGQQQLVAVNPSFDAAQQQIIPNDSTIPTDVSPTAVTEKLEMQIVTTSTPATAATTQFGPAANPIGDREVTPLQYGSNQIVKTVPVISEEERKLLDAMVSSNSLNSVNPTTCSTGPMSKSRNKLQKFDQHQSKAMAINAKGQSTLVTLDIVQNAPESVNVGRDLYEEGEEEAMLQKCKEEAARKGDLSPMHSGKSRKSRTRDRSWDDRINEDVNVRRLPMRVSKQRHAIQTTSTNSNRSKKKA